MENIYYKIKKLLRVIIYFPISLFSKYKLQLDTYSCGPVVVYNALAWAGKDRDFKQLFSDCRCNRKRGTAVRDIDKVIRKHFKKVHFYGYDEEIGTNIEMLDNHLQKGGAVIIRYVFENDLIGHYALIINNKFTVINPVDGKLKEIWTLNRLVDTIRFAPKNIKPPCFWFVEKK